MPTGCKRAGVAVRERVGPVRGERVGRVPGHRDAPVHLRSVDGARPLGQPGGVRTDGALLGHRPGEVDCGWTRGEQRSGRLVDVVPACRSECVAHRRRDADRRRAAHRKRPDRLGHRVGVAAREVDDLFGQPALIEHHDAVVVEAQDVVGPQVAAARVTHHKRATRRLGRYVPSSHEVR